jgi:opacity protein-like surface antigen
MKRLSYLALSTLMLFLAQAPASLASEEGLKQEVSLQGTGFFTKDSQGRGISQRTTDTGGFLLGYRYHFNDWLAAEANYGYVRNTWQNFTSGGTFSVQANVHQATAALVVTPPVSVAGLRPYLLSGSGALVFDPTGNSGGTVASAQRQAKAALVYGGGADYELTRHLSVRAEYRGFVYKRPDFGLPDLNSDVTAHTAQPSSGIIIRF